MTRLLRTRWPLELAHWRWLGGGMLALGAVLPHVPHNPGLACPLRATTGVPCPLCGMTTSVKATCNGHLAAAVAANPFGLVAVAIAVLLLVRPSWRMTSMPAAVAVGLLACSWAWELHRFHLV
jgi:hypothetical protein